MKTIISRKLKWMKPYLELGMGFIPEGKKVTRITAWTFGGRYGKKEIAAILTNDEKFYRIYLHTQYHPRTSKAVLNYSKIDLLQHLAHEMAHMIEIEAHTPDHSKLEARIHAAFMSELKREGYISEEDELEFKK